MEKKTFLLLFFHFPLIRSCFSPLQIAIKSSFTIKARAFTEHKFQNKSLSQPHPAFCTAGRREKYDSPYEKLSSLERELKYFSHGYVCLMWNCDRNRLSCTRGCCVRGSQLQTKTTWGARCAAAFDDDDALREKLSQICSEKNRNEQQREHRQM